MERLGAPAGRQEVIADPVTPQASNFIRLLANSPVATAAYLSYGRALEQGQLSRRERELIALTVAEINACQYGLSAHIAAAREAGLSDEDIREARKADAPDPRNRALLHFTRAVALQRGDISDSDFVELRLAGFSGAEVAEIIANIGLNVFANYFNNVVQTPVDAPLLRPELASTPKSPGLPNSR